MCVVDFRSDWGLIADAWANRCFLRESVVQRSDSKRLLSARKRSGSGNNTDVGHEGVITGRDGFSLRSPMCSLKGLMLIP